MSREKPFMLVSAIIAVVAVLSYRAGVEHPSSKGIAATNSESSPRGEGRPQVAVAEKTSPTRAIQELTSREHTTRGPEPFFVGSRFAVDRVSHENSARSEADLESFRKALREQFTSEDIPELEKAAKTGDGEAAYILHVIYMECSNTFSVPASDAAAQRLDEATEYPANWFSRLRTICGSVDSYLAMAEAMNWLIVAADLSYEPAMLRLITMGFYPAFRLASRGELEAIPRYRAAVFRALSILQDAGVPVAFEVIGAFLADGTFGPPDMKLAYAYMRAQDLMVRISDETSLAYAEQLARHLDAQELLEADAMGWEICQRYARGTCQ